MKTLRISEKSTIIREPVAWKYTVDLDDEFYERQDYQEIRHALINASEIDEFIFHINNDGGRLDVVVPLINALGMSAARTVAICSGNQSSAATIFAMYCDDLIALDHSEFMIHEVQYGAGGTGSNVLAYVQATAARNKKLVTETYSGFLTEEEIVAVLNGQEVYLNADEINRRWPGRVVWREKFYNERIEKETKMLEERVNFLQAALEEVESTTEVVEEVAEVVKPTRKTTRTPKQ